MPITTTKLGPGYPGAKNQDALFASRSIMGNTGDNVIWFTKTATITSAAAATAVSVVADAEVGTGRIVHVTDVLARVNGTTGWGTTATVKLQDTNGTPVDFVTYAVAALTNQARVYLSSSNVTNENALSLNTGGTAGKGLQLKGNANGTGSDLVVTVTGYINDV